MCASLARSTLFSGAMHSGAIALIQFTTGMNTSLVQPAGHNTLITPLDVLKCEVVCCGRYPHPHRSAAAQAHIRQ
jgi:hypothetical protein